jgi:hypothetical protein
MNYILVSLFSASFILVLSNIFIFDLSAIFSIYIFTDSLLNCYFMFKVKLLEKPFGNFMTFFIGEDQAVFGDFFS